MKKTFTKTFYAIVAAMLMVGTAFSAAAQTFTSTTVEAGGTWVTGLARDGAGNLYVLQNHTRSTTVAEVLKYAAGTTTNPVTIYSSVNENTEGQLDDYAFGLAVTSNGDVYVSSIPINENDDFFGSITKLTFNGGNSYSAGPFLTGNMNGVYGFTSLAVDASNNLYALQFDQTLNGGSGEYEIARYNASSGVPSSSSPTIVFAGLYLNALSASDNYSNETGLAVDPSGNVYATDAFDVSNENTNGGAVYKFTPSGPNTWTKSTFLLGTETVALASDPQGDIYATNGSAANSQNYVLTEYAGGNTASPITVTTNLKENGDFYPFAIAALSPQNIFVSGGQETGNTTATDGALYQYLGAPLTPASGVSFSSTTTTATTVSWTNGSGTGRAVFMALASSGTPSPANGTAYTANASFGGVGTQIGSSGWYCVYNGTGTSVNVTGLSSASTYRVMVVEYNGSGTGLNYNTTTATNNPNNVTTATPSTTISSLTAVSGTTTNTGTVQYTATFLASVSGLSTSNFSLNTSGVSGASVASVTGSGTTWTITVNTGAGDGSIQLAMANSTGDSQSVSNLPFSGATYTIDKTTPTVSSITATTPSNTNPTNATSVTYTVSFSEPVTGVDASDFKVTTTGGNATGSSIGVTQVSNSVYTVAVGGITGNGTMRLDLNAGGTGIADAASNPISGGFTSGDAYTIDNTVPVVTIGSPSTTITNTGPVTFDVSFSDANFNTTTFNNNNVTVNATGTANYTQVTSVQNSATDFTVSVTGISGDGTLGISVQGGTSSDLAGNTDTGAGPSATFAVDNTAPTATISAPSVTSIGTGGSGTVSYTVTYADANFNASSLTGSGVTLNATGTASGTVSATGSGTGYTVTISGITGLGTLGISIAAGNASDQAGNTDAGAGPSATFNVLSTDATLTNITVNANPLTPSFSPGVTSYTRNIVHGAQTATIVATADDPGATILVNGSPVASGAASNPIPLLVGLNTVTVLVTAADGVTTQTYTLTLTRAGAKDVLLTSLKLSQGMLSPSYTSSNTSYTSSVVNGVSSLTVTPTTDDPNASVTVNGVAVPSGTASSAIPLAVGPNTVTTAVTAQNDTAMQTYTVIVTRAGASDDFLNSIALSRGTLSPVFTAATTSYTANVANGVTSTTITPTSDDPNATLLLNGTTPIASGATSAAIPLAAGPNVITVKVTAQDGSTIQTYTITITRAPATNDFLTSLSFSHGALNPVFISSTAGYTASVTNNVASTTVTPTAADPNATLLLNGTTAITSGATSAAIPLAVGPNVITVQVTAQDGSTTQTYTVTVTRAPATNDFLTSLVFSRGALNPVFTPSTTSYTANVTNSVTSTMVTPTAADPNAALLLNGTTPIASGTASSSIPLAVGPNVITVKVTAQDGSTTQTYTVTITRAPATNDFLSSLSFSRGALKPAFTSSTTSYTATVANSVSSTTVTPVAADPNATLLLNGSTPIASGTTSAPISLAVGPNIITVTVTAQDGSTSQTYTVTVNRAAATNDFLTSLVFSRGALSPAFTPSTTSYTASVANSVSSTTVTPTAADPNATLLLNGTIAIASGAASAPIALAVGPNIITVNVTAQDGSTNQTYTVTINRAAATNDLLSSLKLSRGALNPVFTGGTTSYSASVVNQVTSTTVTPTAADPNATLLFNGASIASGATSSPIALAVGPNIITVNVTAADGVTNQTYTVTVTRAAGSADSFDPGISVTKPTETVTLAEDGIQVHQGLSPNGDGINDFLQIDNISQYPDNKLKIMNRNGQLVYEASGYDNTSKTFDGHSNKNGQLQLPGTYFYQLDYTASGVTKHKTGFIVLKY